MVRGTCGNFARAVVRLLTKAYMLFVQTAHARLAATKKNHFPPLSTFEGNLGGGQNFNEVMVEKFDGAT